MRVSGAELSGNTLQKVGGLEKQKNGSTHRVRFIVHYQHVFSFWTRSPRLITEHDTEVMPTLRIANKDSFINVIVTTRGKWGITKPQETRRYSNHMNVNLKSKTPVNNCWLFVIIEPSRLEKEVGAFKLQSADSFIFFFPVHKRL